MNTSLLFDGLRGTSRRTRVAPGVDYGGSFFEEGAMKKLDRRKAALADGARRAQGQQHA
jgi:hypothetical protein